MSNHYLPPEMLDHIVGFLRYNTPKLKECCLLSKSWIPRTRKYLFACIRLDLKGNLELWKKAFPDPAESPARYARILLIGALRDKEERRYIEAFSLIEELHVFPGLACSPSGSTAVERAFSLIPFDNFTTSLKTIVVIVIPIPSLEIINIILRLPLPENLTLHCGNFSYNHYNFYDEDSDDKPDGLPTLSHESTTALTGTLNLNSCHSVSLALCHILNMPRGLRFRGLRLSRLIALDLALVTELVMACSDTLEHLDFTGEINDDDVPSPIDLSKATKLKHATFCCNAYPPSCGWIFETLKTIKSEHRDLQKITIRLPFTPDEIDEGVETAKSGTQWSDLDHSLVQLIKFSPEFEYPERLEEDWARHLWPET